MNGCNIVPEPSPEIHIKQGTEDIPNGGNYSFGYVQVQNDTPRSSEFNIKNKGLVKLNLTGTPSVEITGENASDFSIQTQPETLVAPGTSTTFAIDFTPGSTGTKTATVSIENDDPDENPYKFTIEGEGSVAPTVFINSSEKTPTNATPIPVTITFSEEVKGFEITDITVVNGTANRFQTKDNINFTLSIIPSKDGTVTIDIAAGVAQSSEIEIGNEVSPQFSIEYDSTAPTVVSTYPENQAKNVALNINITATFKESMEESLITTSSFTLSDGTNTISGQVSYDDANLMAIFNPDSDLNYSIKYTATVKKEVSDLAENNMESNYTWTFTTEGVIAVNPTNGLETTELGGEDTFTVKLNTQPTANVSISLSSSDTTEGWVSDTSLTFTPDNWDRLQQVTVTGRDDPIVDGDQPFTIITGPASSTDSNYNGINPPDVSVTNIDAEPEINVKQGTMDIPSPNGSYDFGSVMLGSSSSPVTFTIENTGSADLVLSGIPKTSITGTDASMFSSGTPPTSPVDAGDNTTFAITFSPKSTRSKTATVTIPNNDSEKSTYTFNITGNGTVEGTVEVPTFTPGGGTYASTQNVMIETSKSGASIRYTTDGSTPSSTYGIIYSGTPVSITSTTTLKAIAYKAGWITSSLASAYYEITVISIIVSPSSLNFGTVTVGQYSDKSVTISNSSSSTTNLTGNVSISGSNYSITSGDGSYNLLPGASKTVIVRFSPSSTGTKNGNVSVSHNANNNSSPIPISLTGIGDPITWSDYTNEDAMIIDESSVGRDQNWGTVESLWVGLMDPYPVRALIDFNVASVIPSGATIIEATLRVYQTNYRNVPFYVRIAWVTGTWREDTVRWGNQPLASYYTNRSFYITSKSGYVYLDVTSEVQRMVNDWLSEGFMIIAVNQNADQYWVFDSSETIYGSSRIPFLIIKYVP